MIPGTGIGGVDQSITQLDARESCRVLKEESEVKLAKGWNQNGGDVTR